MFSISVPTYLILLLVNLEIDIMNLPAFQQQSVKVTCQVSIGIFLYVLCSFVECC